MVALLVFINSYLEIVFGRKKLLGANGLFGDNVIKNPARYIYIDTDIDVQSHKFVFRFSPIFRPC